MPTDPKVPSSPQDQANHPTTRTPEGHLDTRNPQVVQERMRPPAAAERNVHEAVKKGGEVPLADGHPRNPPGSIPRSPGEWPSGTYPPEHPQGPKPAEEADKAANSQKK